MVALLAGPHRAQRISGAARPCLIGHRKHRDRAHRQRLCKALALSYAPGGGGAAASSSHLPEECETDLFGEQACSAAASPTYQAGSDWSRRAAPKPVSNASTNQSSSTWGGIANMRHSISNTAEYGDIKTGLASSPKLG